MSNPTVTLVGRLAGDPELRFTPSGSAVATFTIVTSDRAKVGDEWQDKDTTFTRCQVWREQAENVAESLSKGAEVIVVGRLKQRSWETKEGEKRTVFEVDVDHVGPSLRWASAKVTKASRGGKASAATADPWATTGTGAGGYADDEPPF